MVAYSILVTIFLIILLASAFNTGQDGDWID